MRFTRLGLILSMSVPFAAMANAEEVIFNPTNISAEMGIGSLSGKTTERVYDPDAGGHKNSQLTWKYNNAAVIKGAFDWDFMPWISFGAAGWSTIASRNGNLVDTDWQDYSQQGWTDQSEHPNTRLNFANEFDFNLKGWLFNEPAYRLGIMAGYQESRYSFKATGGSYHYTDEDTGLSDIGSFPSRTMVIGYKQRYKVPYVGMQGRYRYERFELGIAFKYSGWVRSSDSDQHYLSDTIFNDNINKQKFYSLAGNLGYVVTSNATVYVEGVWNRTTNKKGTLHVNDYGEGIRDSQANSGGIENYNFITTVGLNYTF